jgi:protein-L-isoaspartate O-methyltransferase
MAAAGVADRRLEAAFATVRREEFPWPRAVHALLIAAAAPRPGEHRCMSAPGAATTRRSWRDWSVAAAG